MKIEQWPVDKPVPYEKNPRINDGAVEATAKSIEAFGFRQPIVVDKAGVIVVGHTRLKAAKALGLKEVPVHVGDFTEAEAMAYRIADNKTGELAEWDEELLAAELAALEDLDFDFAGAGFDMDEVGRRTGVFDVDEEDAPDLADGDKPPFENITFILHTSQADLLRRALALVEDKKSEVNTNSNGNAIAFIVGEWIDGRRKAN